MLVDFCTQPLDRTSAIKQSEDDLLRSAKHGGSATISNLSACTHSETRRRSRLRGASTRNSCWRWRLNSTRAGRSSTSSLRRDGAPRSLLHRELVGGIRPCAAGAHGARGAVHAQGVLRNEWRRITERASGLRATKGEPLAKITYIVEQYGACAWYRCYTPGAALRELGHDVVLDHAPSIERLKETEIYVFQRPARSVSLDIIRKANKLGRMTVVEIDDDYWNLHPTNPVYASWKDSKGLRVLEESTRAAQMVTVTTKELSEVIRPMNRNVRVLENVLPAAHWPKSPKPVSKDSGVVVGWAGGSAHFPDLKLLSGTVEQLLRQHDDIIVAIGGMKQVPFESHERLHFYESVKIEHYPDMLARFDIGLAPVVDSRFNRCKSDLKYIEYSMIGIPTVASRIPTYERTVTHGHDGFLARNPKDWLKHVQRLIEDADLREEVGLRARELAESRTIERSVCQWEEAYGLR